MTKSARNCLFGHIYCRNPWWKTPFLVQCYLLSSTINITEIFYCNSTEALIKYSRCGCLTKGLKFPSVTCNKINIFSVGVSLSVGLERVEYNTKRITPQIRKKKTWLATAKSFDRHFSLLVLFSHYHISLVNHLPTLMNVSTRTKS